MEQMWPEFLRYYAGQSNRGSIRRRKGVEAAWAHSVLLVNNGTYLTSSVEDTADLDARCLEADSDAQLYGLPWLFFLYEPLLNAGTLAQADSVFAARGLERAGNMRVMSANCSELKPPLRPLPKLEMKRADTGDVGFVSLLLNCRAYGMPEEIAGDVMDTKTYFANHEREFGYVAYADGEPVSTTSVLVIENLLYVDLVATAPQHQKKGYAEAVMRHALAEASLASGLDRTMLDASDMGRPLYAQMGYAAGPAWRYYVKP